MLKVSETLSKYGILDIFPLHPIQARAGSGIPEDIVDRQVISVDVDSEFIVDTTVFPPITEERIIEAALKVKAMYMARSMRYYTFEYALAPEFRTLPTGTITMAHVNDELARPTHQQIHLNDAEVREMAGKPSGTISLADLRGKSRDFWTQSGVTRWTNAEATWWIPVDRHYANATIQFTSGAAVHSTSTGIYAMHVRNVRANHVILEFLSGSRCVGCGGAGGAGGSTGGGGAGGGGGAAIYRGQTLTVHAHAGSVVAGGGGGGGGGGACTTGGGKSALWYCGGGGGGGGYGGGGGAGPGGMHGGNSVTRWPTGGGAGSDGSNGGGGIGGIILWSVGKGGASGGNGGDGAAGGWAGAAGGHGGTAGGNGGDKHGGGPGGGGAGTGLSLQPNAEMHAYTLHPELLDTAHKHYVLCPTLTKATVIDDPDVEFVYKNATGDTILTYRSGATGMPGELIVHGVDDGNFKLIKY